MTTLAQQLKKTAVVRQRATDKIVSSLLYDGKNASAQEMSDVLSKGAAGLKQLKLGSKKFNRYQSALFSQSCLDLDRMTMSPSDEVQLRKTLDDFFLDTCAFFLDPNFVVALEWLIRKFRVNDLNTSTLLYSYLPFHETTLFAKLASLLDLTQIPEWKFLKEFRNPLRPINRTRLVSVCLGNFDLFKKIQDFIIHINGVNPVAASLHYTFFAATAVAFMKTIQYISESFLTTNLTYLLKALNDESCGEFRCSGLIILGQLLGKAQLSEAVNLALIKSLLNCKEADKAHVLASLLVIIRVYQTQSNLPIMDTKMVVKLVELPGVLKEHLGFIIRNYESDMFFTMFLKVLLIASFKSDDLSPKLLDVFSKIPLTEVHLELIFNTMNSEELKDELKKKHSLLKDMLKILQKKYPLFLIKLLNDENVLTLIREAIRKSLKGTLFEVKENSELPLFLGLNDYNSSVRLNAVKSLGDCISKKLDDGEHIDQMELEFTKNALLDRLVDDDEAVVSEVLTFSSILKLAEPDQLIQNLREVSQKFPNLKQTLALTCIKEFSDIDLNLANDLCDIVFDNLLHTDETVDFLKKIILMSEGTFNNGNHILKGIHSLKTTLFNPSQAKKFNEKLLELMCLNLKDISTFLPNIIKRIESKEYPLEGRILAINLFCKVASVGSAITKETFIAWRDQLLKALEGTLSETIDYFQHSAKPKVQAKMQSIILEKVYKNELKSAFVYSWSLALINMLNLSQMFCEPALWLVIPEEDHNVTYFVRCFRLLKDSPFVPDSAYLKTIEFINIPFLAHVWNRQDSKDALKAYALEYALNLSKDSITEPSVLLLMLPWILTAIYNGSSLVVKLATDCINLLRSHGTSFALYKLSSFAPLIYHRPTTIPQDFAFKDFIENLAESMNKNAETPPRLDDFLKKFFVEEPDKKKLLAYRQVLYFFFESIQGSDLNERQSKLLRILEPVSSRRKLFTLINILEKSCDNMELFVGTKNFSTIIQHFIDSLDEEIAKDSDTRDISIICKLLRSSKILGQKKRFDFVVSLVTKLHNSKHFSALSVPKQKLFLEVIFTFQEENDLASYKKLLELLQHTGVDSAALIQIIADIVLSMGFGNHNYERTKKLRTSSGEHNTETKEKPLLKLLMVTEFISTPLVMSKIRNFQEFLGPLFEVFAITYHDEQLGLPVLSLEYFRQVLLATLVKIMDHIKKKKLEVNQNLIRADMVITCIRTSKNRQTHHQALNAISGITELAPELVLPSMMPLFTFMGSELNHHDDEFSFNTMTQTLKNIINVLKKQVDEDLVTQNPHLLAVSQGLIDAFFHIPPHRLQFLYETLVNQMGEQKYLVNVLAQLLSKSVGKYGESGNRYESIHSFIISFCNNCFSPDNVLNAVGMLLNELSTMPNEIDNSQETPESLSKYFNSRGHTSKELRMYKISLVKVFNKLVSNDAFVENAKKFTTKPTSLEHLDIAVKQVFEALIDITLNSPTKKNAFVKSLIAVTYEMLEKVTMLTSFPYMAKILMQLMHSSKLIYCRKALQLLNKRMEELTMISSDEVSLCANLPRELTKLIEEKHEVSNPEIPLIRQSAMILLAQCLRLWPYKNQFLKCIPALLNSLQTEKLEVAATSLICMAVYIHEFELEFSPYLPRVMKAMFQRLEQVFGSKQKVESVAIVYLMSCLGLFKELVDELGPFLSPYLLRLNTILFKSKLRELENEEVETKLNDLARFLAKEVPCRLSLPACFDYYSALTKNPFSLNRMNAFASFITEIIENMPKDSIGPVKKGLGRFYATLMQIRTVPLWSDNQSDLNEVEDLYFEGFIKLVMKLNESTFQPLFTKLLNECFSSEMLSAIPDSEEGAKNIKYKQLTFLRLFIKLNDALKDIMTPYIGYFLEDALKILQEVELENGDERELNMMLWEAVIDSFTGSFQHDNEKVAYWNEISFNRVYQPLVQQLELLKDVSAEEAKSMLYEHLVPCLGYLAVAAGKDTLWKPLSQQVLMLTRSSEPVVRLGAIAVLEEFYRRVKEPYLSMLPESIPFIAELLEDEDGKVEQAVQRLNGVIESFLGESIQKYFE